MEAPQLFPVTPQESEETLSSFAGSSNELATVPVSVSTVVPGMYLRPVPVGLVSVMTGPAPSDICTIRDEVFPFASVASIVTVIRPWRTEGIVVEISNAYERDAPFQVITPEPNAVSTLVVPSALMSKRPFRSTSLASVYSMDFRVPLLSPSLMASSEMIPVMWTVDV